MQIRAPEAPGQPAGIPSAQRGEKGREAPRQRSVTPPLTAEKPPRQQGLHIASSVGNHIDNHVTVDLPVNHPVRFEEHLPVLFFKLQFNIDFAADFVDFNINRPASLRLERP